MKAIPVLALISVMFLAGCVQQQGSTNQTLYNPPTGYPALRIISPSNGDVINGTAVGIRVNVTNFRLADTTANPVNRQNEGHLRYYLDDREQMTPHTIISYTGVTPGAHVIRVELVNNDHSLLTPTIFDTVTITTQ